MTKFIVPMFYREALARVAPTGLVEAIDQEAESAAASGPYGTYPEGPLSSEDKGGLHHRVAVERVAIFGRRLSAALEHAHFLVFRPRDASPAALQALLDASWSTDDIVTLSQIVAFLSFQIRVVHGLRVLAEAGVNTGYPATAVAAE